MLSTNVYLCSESVTFLAGSVPVPEEKQPAGAETGNIKRINEKWMLSRFARQALHPFSFL